MRMVERACLPAKKWPVGEGGKPCQRSVHDGSATKACRQEDDRDEAERRRATRKEQDVLLDVSELEVR